MKNIFKITFVLFLFSFNTIFAQNLTPSKPERNVPIIVAQAFEARFPNKEPIWFSQYQGRYNDKLVYDARFLFDNRYSSAIYDRDGKLVAFAATLEAKEIPQKAINYMKENYTDRGVTEAIMVSRGERESTIELGIYINNRFTIVVFDEAGNFIKTTLG